MKFLIVMASSIPILIPFGSKYSPEDPILKYLYPTFSFFFLVN